jgi:hypothetical protein
MVDTHFGEVPNHFKILSGPNKIKNSRVMNIVYYPISG